MINNLLKIILRNLWRNKGYSTLNIIGMGIGIAALVWGVQTYRFCFSFDNFHKDGDKVYRALSYKDGGDGIKGVFPMPAVQQAQNDFSGITATARLESKGINIKYDNHEPFTEDVYFTDQAFFDMFNFPVAKGYNNIKNKNTVLITERTAKKYFGNTDPLGKSLIFYSDEKYALPLTVTGVLKDVPLNSTIQFDIITGFDNFLLADGNHIAADNWSWLVDAAFFKIPDPKDAARVEKELNKYNPVQNKAREDWKLTGYKLVSLKEHALMSNINSNGLYERPDDSAAYGPFILAFLIFLSACLNFSNTTVSRANRRLKEIGLRKVMGSSHHRLIFQMLFECAFIVLLATLLSVVFNNWWFPVFNEMFNGLKISADYFHDTGLLMVIAVAVMGTTVLAGGYPAFYISRFNPSIIFRGTVKFGGNNLFSRIMLGLQLSIAIITVIAGISFARNAEFQKNYDFGYNLNSTIGVLVADTNSFAAFKNEVAAIPLVSSLAGTRHHIGYSRRNAVAEALGVKKETKFMEIGKDYLNVMGLKMAEGRAFDSQMEGDYTNSILITQKLAAMYGWNDKEALGKQIHIDSSYFSVVGVLKNFQGEELFNPMEPVVMKLGKEDRYQYLVIQAKQSDLTAVFAKTRDAWKKIFPNRPYSGFYQSQMIAESYKVSKSIATIFTWFSLVSILLTITGLFALVSLTILKKMKEIALRKVVGANAGHILVLVNKGYFWVFIVAAAIGCYGGWSLTNLLLNMIFKTNAGIPIAALSGSIAALFLIAGIVSSLKVWHAIRTNPVKLLRTE